MKQFILFFFTVLFASGFRLLGQEVPIGNAFIDNDGRIRIEVASTDEHYYVLYVRDELQDTTEWAVSVTMGENGTTTLTESLAAYPVEHYRVMQHRIDNPADTDDDGRDDITELNDGPRLGPLNPADPINMNDGTVCIHDHATFQQLSYQGSEILIDTHLDNLEFVKFYILNTGADHPQVYFMNTVTHRSHRSFANAIGIGNGSFGGGGIAGEMRGEIIYHPRVIAANGKAGVYRFEFEPNDSYGFENVRKAYELLAANMTLLQNNLSYYPMPNAALPLYHNQKSLYDSSRVSILLEEEVYNNIGYIALNIAEGYGLLRVMKLEDRPNSREIVLYESLPNEMPRVGGIITTVPQTPLSHVNLRAIQDDVPNAYIAGALQNDAIASLVGKYVYYRVGVSSYEIREATLAEVEAYYAGIRPKEEQVPIRDLSVTQITPLDEISFGQSVSFGVKAANVATMRDFGFPEGTIPNGFAVPFYFYDAFMKHNGFYDVVREMIATPGFLDDYDTQEEMLADFRKTIKEGEMPVWMWDALSDLQAAFPAGTSIRCRSSTNNEDLPGFSGAGLYDSKTQHPDEGHISKSIRQVYASMWNFRAFDERQFYRIDHFIAAMGVLVHPNYSDEKANGVGVTTDPVYQTNNTYYLNTQIGEDLVTNPDALSIPEEILLEASPGNPGYTLIRPSNQVTGGGQIMSELYLDEMREYLQTIHDEFRLLYQASSSTDFAMEIEYKITSEGKLAIKQARPWADYWDELGNVRENITEENPLGVSLKNYPNPFESQTQIEFEMAVDAQVELRIFDIQGKKVNTVINEYLSAGRHTFSWNGLDNNGVKMTGGVYFYQLIVQAEQEAYSLTRQMVML